MEFCLDKRRGLIIAGLLSLVSINIRAAARSFISLLHCKLKVIIYLKQITASVTVTRISAAVNLRV